MDATALFTVVDDAVAAAASAPLELLVAAAPLIGGVAVAELSATLLPALPDDSVSWGLVEEAGNRLEVLAAEPFSRVARDLGDGVTATCAMFERGARVVTVALPDSAAVVLVAVAFAGDRPAVWRAHVPPVGELADAPALIVAVDRLRRHVTS